MLRTAATIVTALLLSTLAARAADMVSASEADFVAEEPPPVPVFSWGGPYVGLQAGYAFGRDRAGTAVGATGMRAVIGSSPNGVIGGAHAGYLLSTGPLGGLALLGGAGKAAVIGLEGDIDGTSYGGKGFAPGTANGLAAASLRSPVTGSIRARFGIAAQRVLVYGTGGVAFADEATSDMLAAGAPEGFSHERAGYTLGGGVEWALMNQLSLRAEYRYSDFGHVADPVAAAGGPATIPVVHHDSNQRLQTGFSYRLGGPAS